MWTAALQQQDDLRTAVITVSFPFLIEMLLLWNPCRSNLLWIGNVGFHILKVPVLCQASVEFLDSIRQVSCLFKDVCRHLLQSSRWAFNSNVQKQGFKVDWTYGKLWHVSLIFIQFRIVCYYLKEGQDLFCYEEIGAKGRRNFWVTRLSKRRPKSVKYSKLVQ